MIADIRYKAFGDKVIFNNFKLEIPEGVTIAIEGPSGKGKTTLLRILSGLDKDFDGAIENMPKKPIILFQEDRLVETISLESNLLMVSDDKERINYLLKELRLDGELKNKISSFSGGMKRRAAILRALLADCDALFLDEPFKGLDGALKESVAALIRRENKGKTLILITHDRIEAELLNAELFINL
ncbi:MAG: ATP-binding cassette domain-containing protein [Spirochaetales bacterium]|nr:ATP-binding cassette domain-containing protein [Spirochaetales bacterium]MBQ2259192.1 ATP-binding cassette domain-containing protein [Spirochaetales bacterium]